MTARAVLTVVGQAAGAYVGAMVGMPHLGAAIGGAIGGAVGGAIDGPVRNSQALLEDLGAIKFDYGSTWPRIYGRYRFKVAPMWSSTKRPVAHEEEVDSKGGPAAVNTSFTYVMDWLCWAPLNATGYSRIWVNGELKFSNLPESNAETLTASAQTTAWASVTFFDGNAAQLPWAIYEAAVGTANASAYRHRRTFAIDSLDLGGSGQPPLVEVEFFTSSIDSALATLIATLAPNIATVGPIHVDANGITYLWFTGFEANSGVIVHVNFDGTSEVQGSFQNSATSGEMPFGQTNVPAGIVPINDGNLTHSVGDFFIAGGGGYSYEISNFLGYSQIRWAYRTNGGTDNLLVMGSESVGTKQLWRISGDSTTANSAVMNDYVQSIALDASYVYAVEIGGAVIYQLGQTALNLVDSIVTPTLLVGDSAAVFVNEADELFLACETDLWQRVGASWVLINDALGDAASGDQRAAHLTSGFMLGDTFYMQTQYPLIGGSSFHIYRADLVQEAQDVVLSSIVSSECLLTWTGEDGALTAADIDVSALTAEVTGYATTGSPRESVAQLMDMFYFGAVCSDKLYFRLRGAAAVDTIAFDETGSGVGQSGEPFTGVERGNDLEVAIQVAVTGPNLLSDYEPGTEESDRLVGESVELRRYSTPVVFTPVQRKGRADTMVLDGRIASHTGQISLDDRHVELEPFDVWNQYDDEGNLYRVRSERETYTDSGRDFDVVLDDSSVLSSVGITSSTDDRTITINIAGHTELILIDGPIMRDADDGAGLYAALVGSGRWAGGSVYAGDTVATLTSEGTVLNTAIAGTTTTALGDWTGGNVFDTANVVRMTVRGGSLSSSTIATELASGVNYFAFIKADGTVEIVQAVTSTLVAADTYDLSVLLRGRRGTEHAMTGHAIGEKVVWLRATGLVRTTDELADIDIDRYYKGVTIGQTTATGTLQTFSDTGVSLMPFAPVNLTIDVDDVVSWNRRSRLSSRFLSPLGDPPLGEASESYLAQLYNDSDVLQTSATVTVPEWDITGTGFVPGWYVQIAQNSAAIGAGYTSTLVL